MIKIDKILVPTDLSECARHALGYATELASAYNATLHIVHVVSAVWIATYGGMDPLGQEGSLLEDQIKVGKNNLKDLKREIGRVEVEGTVLVGIPDVEIVRFARANDIDLIVIATHGHTGFSHALLGSVTEKIVQMAPCPVLTIKQPEHEFVMPWAHNSSTVDLFGNPEEIA